jgi:hypothetical protein
MSLEGQRAQHVFEDYSATFAPPEDVEAALADAAKTLPVLIQQLTACIKADASVACDVSDESMQQVHSLVNKLLEASQVTQRSRCCVLAGALSRTLHALISDEVKFKMTPAVVLQWAEASKHCMSRWEGEIFSMHDWICGQRTLVHSREAEDIVLKVLHDWRAQLAEGMLHALKASVSVADEIHFENYFYSTLRLGVQAQTRGDSDPSRMNYMQLQVFDVTSTRLSFERMYTPAGIRDVLRSTIFEASSGADIREKMYDWMRANIPVGYCAELAPDKRQEAWLNDECHDSDYRVTDAALSFMLCRMHVLQFDTSTICPSASRVVGNKPLLINTDEGAESLAPEDDEQNNEKHASGARESKTG